MDFYRSQGTKYHQDVIDNGFYGGGMSIQPEQQARNLFKYYLSLNVDDLNENLFDTKLISHGTRQFWDSLFTRTELPVWEKIPFYNETLQKHTFMRKQHKTKKRTVHQVRDLSTRILYYGRHNRKACPFVSTGMNEDVKVATSTADTLYKITINLKIYVMHDNGVLAELTDSTSTKGGKCLLAIDNVNLPSANHIVYIHAFTGAYTNGEATFFTKIPPAFIQHRVNGNWVNILGPKVPPKVPPKTYKTSLKRKPPIPDKTYKTSIT